VAIAMRPSAPIRRSADGHPAGLGADVLRALRALLCSVPLAWVLGGGCTLVYSSGHDDNNDGNKDDGTTVVVTTASSGGDSGTQVARLDPELFRMGGGSALSPTRLWQPGQIGERELAAFAAGVLAVNAERLGLPVPASELQYLDTQIADGQATVRFARRAGAAGPLLSARFAATGELVSVERELR
jgi:hypothetical protein